MKLIKEYIELNLIFKDMKQPTFSTFEIDKSYEERNRLYEIEYDKYDAIESKIDELRNEIRKDKNGLLEYWRYIIEDYKYSPRYKFVCRLSDRANGLYYENVLKYEYTDSLIDHMHSKRPYGNKNIPASVLYSLGIDKYNVLEIIDSIPEEIEEWCFKLHEETIEDIRKFDI